MLNDAVCFKQVYIVTSYNDLRSEIDRLAALITSKTGDNPFVPDTLYLFCGRKTDRIRTSGACRRQKSINFIKVL